MKPGKEYEIFIYEKFIKLFSNFNVKLNDKILGLQSGIKREIDISIRGISGEIELLYLVQCKDHNKPADVKIIGEFSSVIKDIGASKGFLICTSGFTKTIYNYAKSLGIELLTIEDINSIKWNIEIQIPIIYIYKVFEIAYDTQIHVNEALAQRCKTDLVCNEKDFEIVSNDNNITTMKLIDYLNMIIENDDIDIENDMRLEINDPNLQLLFAGIWVNIKLTVEFILESKYYLKYVTPLEYSQITNHVTNEKIPLNLRLKLNFKLDDTYFEIQKDDIPVKSTVRFEIEDNIRPISSLKFEFFDIKASP